MNRNEAIEKVRFAIEGRRTIGNHTHGPSAAELQADALVRALEALGLLKLAPAP